MKNVFQQNLMCLPSRYTTHRMRALKTRPRVLYHLINYHNRTFVNNFGDPTLSCVCGIFVFHVAIAVWYE